MEPDRGSIAIAGEEPPPSEPMDLLSSAWCSSAIQVLQTGPKEDCSLALVEHPVVALDDDRRDLSQLQRNDRSLVVDSSGFGAAQSQWKYDDLKSYIWLQKAIHPELDYDNQKKWLPRKMAAPWSGISLKKWVKERKQKRKEEARLQRAEVHAAVSVAGVAALLAAIAAENSASPARGSAPAAARETSVASAAALVAAQCAKVAEAAGATRDQVSAAVRAAVAATDASNVITLTAAAATSLRGAAALRGRRGGSGRQGQSERGDQAGSAPWQDDLDFDFNHARSKAALARGDEMFVAMPDGKWKLHTVSAAPDRNGKLVLRIKKMSLVMQAFSNAKECIVHDVSPCAPEKASREEDATYPIEVATSKGKVELRADDYAVYHSSRKRGTVVRTLTRERRPGSRVGVDSRYGTSRWRERVPMVAIQKLQRSYRETERVGDLPSPHGVRPLPAASYRGLNSAWPGHGGWGSGARLLAVSQPIGRRLPDLGVGHRVGRRRRAAPSFYSDRNFYGGCEISE